MKKPLLVLCFLMGAIASFAQIKIGVKEGLNIASIDYTWTLPDGSEIEDVDVSALASFHIGGFLTYALTDRFAIQGELMYSGQGAKIDYFGVYKTKNKLNYISLPVLFKYQTSSGFNFEAGLGLDFLVSAKQSYDEIDLSQIDPDIQLSDTDLKEYLTSVDSKFLLGAGYELPSGLSFYLRYAIGLSNVSKEVDPDDPEYLGGEESYNNVFQLGVGFPLYGN